MGHVTTRLKVGEKWEKELWFWTPETFSSSYLAQGKNSFYTSNNKVVYVLKVYASGVIILGL